MMEMLFSHLENKILYPQNGYYLYRDRIWATRQDIADDMFANNLFNNSVEFHFNDKIFGSIDWTKEPDISLDQLYINRAKQIRDEYDYVILSYSGGSDSHEILEVCLNNNIFIDEVQIYNYEKCVERIDPLTLLLDRDLANFLEFNRAVIPELKKLCQRSPNTKITVVDVSDDFMRDITTNNFNFINMDKQFGKTALHGSLNRLASGYIHYHNSRHFQSSKSKVAFVRGFEKPILLPRNGELVFHFNDIVLNGVNLLRHNGWNMYTIENFFWSKDAPLIPVKQSHVLKKVFENDIQYYTDFIASQQKRDSYQWKLIPTNYKEFGFDRSYIPYLYKYWDSNKFSAKKPTISPDLKLASMHLQNQNPFRASIVQTEYIRKKFQQIPKWMINKRCLTRGYSIGQVNLTQDKYDLIGA